MSTLLAFWLRPETLLLAIRGDVGIVLLMIALVALITWLVIAEDHRLERLRAGEGDEYYANLRRGGCHKGDDE